MQLKNNHKYLGGTIRLNEAATDKVMPDGTKRSWEKSVKIVEGKKEIKVGQSFFDKIAYLLDNDEFREFIKDIE